MLSTKISEFFIKHQSKFTYIISGIIGALLGALSSLIVNCTLIEISINPFFSVYFGILFILIGSVILWRVRTGGHPKPYLLTGFSIMIIISGLLCFILEKNWFTSISAATKVPLYTILGVSVTFALMFSLVDILNYFCVCSSTSKPLVETELQVYLLAMCACLLGASFGLIFGLLDIEDEKLYNLRVALLRDQSYCYPIGSIIGALGAVANQFLRDSTPTEYQFDALKTSDDLDGLDDEDVLMDDRL